MKVPRAKHASESTGSALAPSPNMQSPAVQATGPADPEEARELREELVRDLAESGAVTQERVLSALRRVPRHLFVPGASLRRAYTDAAALIGHEQTISQPTVVGIMTEALELQGRERVLEIGTGSGYQAAILSLLALEVYTVELVPELAEKARDRLRDLGYANVHVRAGDGYDGWPEHAPFDRVVVTAAPAEVPTALLDQLTPDGVLIAPVGWGEWTQRLLRYRKTGGRTEIEDLGGVRFVPMVSRA